MALFEQSIDTDKLNTKEESIVNDIIKSIDIVKEQSLDSQVKMLNRLSAYMRKISPFRKEPVTSVKWVPCDKVIANDYNPNSVAPPEMELLHISIQEDGYTQPIVTYYHDGIYEVVDGFHRNRVGKEYADIKSRVHSYLPVVVINDDVADKGQRIASTIRHNRARGKHQVEAMSDIVLDLKRKNWSDEKIARELGMDSDEVLRLAQITGLAEMFADKEFSEAWECEFDEEELISEEKVLKDGE